MLRDGVVVARDQLERLRPDDVVMAMAPDETVEATDRLFSPRPGDALSTALGDFVLEPDVPMATVVDLYGLPGTLADRAKTVGGLLAERLRRAPVVGDRVHLGLVDLIVRRLDGDEIAEIGVALEPDKIPLEGLSVRRQLRRFLATLVRRKR